MLQGWLVNADILFQLKYPILVNIHEQDITRRRILTGAIFFLFRTVCPQLMQRVFLFQEANSKIVFPWDDSSGGAVVPLQGSQGRLAEVHGISDFSESWNMIGLCEPSWLIQGWCKYNKALKHIA